MTLSQTFIKSPTMVVKMELTEKKPEKVLKVSKVPEVLKVSKADKK